MKILFATPSLSAGGIEVQALRMSEAFAKAGHEVILYDFYPLHRNKAMVGNYNTNAFRIIGSDEWSVPDWLSWKAHALLFKSGIYKNLKPSFIKRHFSHVLEKERPDVICSLSFHEDYIACNYGPPLGIPVIVSMHGTYEYASPEWPFKARFIYEHASAIIYIADKNLSWYNDQPYYKATLPIAKIYNGTDLQSPIPRSISRTDIGALDSSFIYVMVARGIKEKGWLEALMAFRQIHLHFPETMLLLIGEGEYLSGLKEEYSNEPGILFYGFHPNPLELIQLANVGLLPSYFALESLPNVILDYLRCGLPVIGSDIGEIPAMLTQDDGSVAGDLLPRTSADSGVDVSNLSRAMEKMVAEPEMYKVQVVHAKAAAQKFDIRDCIARYTEVFEQVIGQ